MRRILLGVRTAAILLLTIVPATGQCKGKPLLEASYDGFGMVITGKYLYLRICDSGEYRYDSPTSTEMRVKSGYLTKEQQAALKNFLDRSETRSLKGTYAGTGAIDYVVTVRVTITRPEGLQEFIVKNPYSNIEKTYPTELRALLCHIDNLRPDTDLKTSVDSKCEDNRKE